MKKYLYLLLIIVFFPIRSYGASESLVIYSLQISGHDSSTEEFVGIKNISKENINLEKYTLVRKSQNSTTWNTLLELPNVDINPGQVIIIGHVNYKGSVDLRYTTGSSIAPNNAVAIRRPDKSIIDLVGLGDSTSYEGSPVQNPEDAEYLTRLSDVDNDNNQEDFTVIEYGSNAYIDVNISEVVISEIMPNPDTGKEWFELFNPTSQVVSLSGLKICDGLGSIKCYLFKDSDILNPFEYKIYSQEITKITLNNTGDFLEILGPEDQIFVSTGENYGSAERGLSLSLFGNVYKWSSSPTPLGQNVFTEEPLEDERSATKKSSAKKTSIGKTSTMPKTSEKESRVLDSEVKGAEYQDTSQSPIKNKKDIITNQQLGIGLMAFSIILLLGYNLWLKKDEIAKVYYKIRSRNN